MLKLATLCYLKSGGRTLMLHRIKKENDMHAGKWNGLGGKFLPGETPEACAIREVQEESGLTMHRPVLRGIITFPGFPQGSQPNPTQADDPNSDDWYTFVFVASEFSGTLIDSNEGVLGWIEDEKLFDLNLWPGDRIFLRWLDQEAFFSGHFRYVNGELQEHDVTFYRGTQWLGDQVVPTVEQEQSSAHQPLYHPEDDTYCWVCNGPVLKRHCKIVCQTCGFTRDCSDP